MIKYPKYSLFSCKISHVLFNVFFLAYQATVYVRKKGFSQHNKQTGFSYTNAKQSWDLCFPPSQRWMLLPGILPYRNLVSEVYKSPLYDGFKKTNVEQRIALSWTVVKRSSRFPANMKSVGLFVLNDKQKALWMKKNVYLLRLANTFWCNFDVLPL